MSATERRSLANVSRGYVTSGNASITAIAPKDWADANGCERRLEFRVAKKSDSKAGGRCVYFVSALLQGRWNYIGLLDAECGVVKPTAKSAIPDGSPVFRLLNRCLLGVWKNSVTIDAFMGFVCTKGMC